MPKAGEKTYFDAIGEDGVAHSLNKPFSEEDRGIYLARVGAIMTLLPAPPARLLDLGCGTGWTSVFYARSGYDVTGQDIAENAIEHARRFAEENSITGVEFKASDYEDLTGDATYDAAVFFDSLHHAEDEFAALRSVYRLLKPGGICLTCEPGVNHGAAEGSIEAVETYGVTEKDMPPKTVARAGRAAGFSEVKYFADPILLNRLAYEATATDTLRAKLMKLAPVRAAGLVYATTRYKRNSGITYLKK